MEIKSVYNGRELSRYQFSLQCMRWLGWVTLAGVIWLGAVLGVRYYHPPLLVFLAHALTGLWTMFGWVILVLFAILVVAVVCLRGLYPTLIKYLKSLLATVDFLDWFRAGIAFTSEKGEVKVQDSKKLEGFIAFLDSGCVLVAVFVPRGVNGQHIVDSSTGAIKEYADSVLTGLKSGAVQRTAGARYWIYRRPRL